MNEPPTHYLCTKTSSRWQTRKGLVYVIEDDEMVHYSTRYQTRLLNADAMIEHGLFEEINSLLAVGCDCDYCREHKTQPETN